MGLDMYLYRANLHGHSVEQASRVENYLDLQQWMKDHPDKTYTLKEWCGQEESDINAEALKALTPEFKLGYSYWDTRKAYGHYRIFQNCAYWRKANAIHSWFVQNVQDGVDNCETYQVTREQLEELVKACQTVLAKVQTENAQVCVGIQHQNGKDVPMMQDGKVIINPEVCAESLPTQSGFFFGSTDYDEYYIEDLEKTVQMLTEVIEQTDWETQTVCYSSSW